VLCDEFRRHPAEIKPLASGDYRQRDLVGFCGGEHKHHIRRRLLKGFQKRIERLAGEHMHLVNYDHLVSSHRRILDICLKFAGVLNSAVRGAVNLKDIGRAPLGYLHARGAPVAGMRRGFVRTLAVERLGDYARRGGLPNSARSREKIRVRYPAVLYCPRKSARYVLLPDDLLKGLRTPFSRKNQIGHTLPSRFPYKICLSARIAIKFVRRDSVFCCHLPDGMVYFYEC